MSWCSRKKPESRSSRISASSSSSRRSASARSGGARVALVQPRAAELRQPPVGAGVLGAGVAVAEVAGQVEAQPLGARRADSATASGWSRKRSAASAGGDQGRGGVAAPLPLGLVQRRAQPDRDQRVLQGEPRAVVGVDVAGGDAGDAEPLGQPRQPAVARAVAAPQRALQLDPEAVGPERREQPPRHRSAPRSGRRAPSARRRRPRGRSPRGRPAPRRGARARRAAARAAAAPLRAGSPSRRARVGHRDQPAEVAPARRRLDQQRDVRPPTLDGQLGADDRPHADPAHACANSIAPQTPSWSVSARAS